MFTIVSLFFIMLSYFFRNEKGTKQQEVIVNENIKSCNRSLLGFFWHWLWESNSSLKFTDDEIFRCRYGKGGGKING